MKLRLVLLTLLSSILFPLALPNELMLYGSPVLGLFCLSFFFWALYEAPSFKFASFLGILFGLVTTVLANYWLKNFNEYAVYTLGGVTLGYVGLNALLAPIIHGFSKLRPGLRPFLTAMLFAVYEYLKSTGFLGYPWGLIAYPPNSILPFIQVVDITGLWGLSFLCSYLNALLAEAMHLRFTFSPRNLAFVRYRRAIRLRSKSLFAAALVLIAFAYGSVRLLTGFTADKTFRVLLVQQNIDPWDTGKDRKGIAAATEVTLRGLRASLSRYNSLPDLIVWSETALRAPVDIGKERPFADDAFNYYSHYFPNLFEQFGTATLTGAPVFSPIPRRFYNTAILVTKDGRVPAFYAKQHPVPFVESIPFMEIGFVREFFNKNLNLYNYWLMGKKSSVFTLPLANGKVVRFGTPICFEDVFPDICREFVANGAELLINISNDSWSETNSALTQHIAAARFRAIETRKPLVRSTNAGLTCVVDPTGEITQHIPLFERDYLLTDVPVSGAGVVTLYTVLGDFLPYLFTVFLLAVLVRGTWGNSLQTLRRNLLAALRRHRRTP